MIGTTLGHYKILEKLGHGGMGEVYLAEDTKLKRQVALKVLGADLSEDEEVIDRFQREAESVAALNHPNIVTLYSVELDESPKFLTMELVEGETLDHLIPKDGLPLERVFEMAIPFADALSAAHEKGIIHRDLKPANVMVTDEGRLKILDFGLAKLLDEPSSAGPAGEQDATMALTQAGVILGTVPYMAPEQVQGKDLDRRSDIFSLGVILFEMATGKRPFSGETSADIISSILRDNPAPVTELKVDMPHHLGRIIRHCLEKDPKRRYQSALDIRNELEDLKREVDSGIVHSETSAITATRGPRPRWLAPAAVVLLLVAASIGAWKFWPSQPDSAPVSGGPASALSSQPSVAVLYFDNLSGNEELQWLRNGLTDMLVTDLSQSPDLRVLSTDRLYQILSDMEKLDERVTSFELVSEVAEKAGADTVILGSFAKLGDTIRISIKVQEAATGEILKADSVLATAQEDIFARVDDLSRNIRQSIELPTAPLSADDRNLTDVSTQSVDAYRAFVEAEALHYQSKDLEAIELYLKAVDLDPTFAMAWAKLSTAHGNMGMADQAVEYAEKALEFVDRLTEPERAYVEGRYYGQTLETHGKAIETYSRTLATYPHLTSLWNNLGVIYSGLWMHDDAIEAFERSIEEGDDFPGTHSGLAGAYFANDQPQKAFDRLEKYLGDHPESFSTLSAYSGLLAAHGDLEAAERMIARAEAAQPGFFALHFPRYAIAVLKEDWEAARGHAEKVGELPFPFARSAVLGLKINLLLARGRHEPANAMVQPSIDAWGGPSLARANSQVGAAMGYYAAGEFERALSHARAAREEGRGQNPDFIGHGIEALAQEALGDREQADALLGELATRIEPMPGDVMRFWLHEVRGGLAIQRGEVASGVAELESAVALLPVADSNSPRVLYALGEAYLLSDRPDKAEAVFRRLLALRTARVFSAAEYVSCHFQLARLLHAKGSTAEARDLFQTFIDHWGDGDMERGWVAEARRVLSES